LGDLDCLVTYSQMTPREIIKTVILSFFIVLVGLALSYAFTQFIFLQTTKWLVALFLWAILLIALLILQCFFLKGLFFSAILTAFETLAIGAFFIGNYSILRLAFLIVLWLSLIAAKTVAGAELANSLKIKFFKTAGLSLGFISKGLAVFITVFYLSFLAFQDPGVVKSHLISAGRFTPGLSFEESIDDVLRRFSSDGKGGGGFLFFNFGFNVPGLGEQLEGVARGQFENLLSDIAGVRVSLTDSVGDTVYNIATNKLSDLSPQMKTAIWIFAGILLYLSVRFVLYITGWLSVLIAFVLFHLLSIFHFFRITAEEKSKEVISL
jgi:hypothetical protein